VSAENSPRRHRLKWPGTQRIITLATIFLVIEFFDELHYGIQGAAMPSIRSDLSLTYAQIGLALGLPKMINTFIEPVLMLLGDSSLRKRLVVGGGMTIVLALVMTSGAQSFPILLMASIISYPASGAFVTLSQATLMDMNPGREPHGMARWTVFGSLGNLIGPTLLAAAFAVGIGWRLPYLGLALFALSLAVIVWRKPFPPHPLEASHNSETVFSWRALPCMMWSNLVHALRVKALFRWVALLEMSDLMLDVLTSYMALYFSDVVGLSPTQTSLVLTVLMITSLASDLLLIPILERVPGRKVVRISAAFSIPLFVGFLVVPWSWAKILLMMGVRLSTIGWYQVLQGEAYAAVLGRSGTVMAINSAAGLIGGVIVWFIGVVANQAGLPIAMWLLLAGPAALVLFVPRPKNIM
jgi:MFS transporter, FSR family, fosmidomycin resistance protein